MSDLHRLIYVSTAIDGADDNLWALTSILNAAERNNLRHGLSGLLLVHDGFFCQVLEGRRQDLDGLMNILSNDRRHADIHVLADTPVDARLFGPWSMAQAVLSPQLQSELDDLKLQDLNASGALDILRRASEWMARAA